MISWREFVREVQLKNKISYKEAMSQASVLWRKKPAHEKKNKPKGPAGIQRVPEISQFPKKLRFVKKKVGVYASLQNIKRKVPEILTKVPRKRKKKTELGPIDDNRFKYLQVGTNYVKV